MSFYCPIYEQCKLNCCKQEYNIVPTYQLPSDMLAKSRREHQLEEHALISQDLDGLSAKAERSDTRDT